MRKRVFSLLLALVMIISTLPSPAIALTLGNGTAENPYQIGDTVVNDGTVEPEGEKAENSYWARTDVPASENLVCQIAEHDHATAGCETAYETTDCHLEGHPTEGELTTFAHEDGTACTWDAEGAKWVTSAEKGYACGLEAHTHTQEAGCVEVTEAHTLWTLTEVPDEADPADADADDETTETSETTETAATEAGSETTATEETEEATERICAEGCILESEAEHLENGDECLVWIACDKTEGCELAWGHEGECTGAGVFAPTTVTVQYTYSSGGGRPGQSSTTTATLADAYIVVGSDDDVRNDTLYYVDSSGMIVDLSGNAVNFDMGTYTIWYGSEGATDFRDFWKTTFTVSSTSTTSTTVTLETASNSAADTVAEITEDQWNWATCVYYNTDICNHIHVRVEGHYEITIGETPVNAYASNPSMTVYLDGSSEAAFTYSWGTTSASYEYTYNTSLWNIDLNREIEVHLKMDLTYTVDGVTTTMEGVEFVYNNMTDRNRWIEFIAVCDGFQGFDFVVTTTNIEEEIAETYKVVYQWKVYNLDGTWSDNLPASVGAHGLPASVDGLQEGANYVYNTGYVEGTSYHDYENGLLYTFHGWDTWSHSSIWNVDITAVGYNELDDGDADASNNKTIEITADTWINGYWTVSELDPADAYLMVHKDVVVQSGDDEHVKNYLENICKMFISIDPGIDKDDDGKSQVDVDYPAAVKEGGYLINVYQYDTPFTFQEHQMDVPGYTRTTTITVSENSNLELVNAEGSALSGNTTSGETANVKIDPNYTPSEDPYNLGTVTFTNTYAKNTGNAVSEYPELYLLKSATDGGFQSGVEFTLYSDEACTTAVGSAYTTDDNGQLIIDFESMTAGTYYLKETRSASGYMLDSCTYAITLTAGTPVEELRNDEYYVQVTYYTLSVVVPEGSTAIYRETKSTGSYSLHVYNEPIVGELDVSKDTSNLGDAIKNSLDAVVIVHGPVTYTSIDSTSAGGDTIADVKWESTWTLNLNSANEFKASIENLPVGKYLIHESFASVYGYTWSSVSYGNNQETVVYNGITSAVFEINADSNDAHSVNLTLTNSYDEWDAAEFSIKKISPANAALAGATFKLYSDESCTQEVTDTGITTVATTGADGYAKFKGFTVPESTAANDNGEKIVTYYLKETLAPAGYYLDDTVYKVEIKAVTGNDNDNATTYEVKVSVKSSGAWVEASNFNKTSDLLTVTNSPVLGQLTIAKAFANGTKPTDDNGNVLLESVQVMVSGPSGYYNTMTLSESNNWSESLSGLPLGQYTITELDASVPYYDWTVSYDEKTVTLTEENPGSTTRSVEIKSSVEITNTYTKREATTEIPTTLTIKKVGEDGTTPLQGAVFTLKRLKQGATTVGENDENVIASMSVQTLSEGTAMFDLLSGFIVNGDDIDGTYILSETTAPDGYQPITTTWTVTIKDEDGKVRVTLNEDRNIFENIWDWIVGGVTGNNTAEWSFANNTLTVQNKKKLGSLTVKKEVVDPKNYYSDATYSFTLDCSDDNFDKTFTLKASETWTLNDIPWGTTYTLTENTTGAAFTSSVSDAGNGKIWADTTQITVTNTYAYTEHNNGLNLVKVDEEDNNKVISGAGFTLYSDAECKTQVGNEVFSDTTGKVKLPIETAGTYYLKETTTPAGYHPNNTVYTVTAEQKYVVKNAGDANAVTEIQMVISVSGLDGTTSNEIDYIYKVKNTPIKNIQVNVEKVWDDGNYYNRPESVSVTLYKDNAVYDTVALNAENGWKHTWTGLTDEFTWTVDEPNVPEEYSKTVTNNGNNWTITNTRAPKSLEITVTKAWIHNGGKDLPESITVTLYKDGQAHDTVALSAANNWTHTWTGLTDASQWRVDETTIPAGYENKIEVDGYKFQITNTRIINPVEITVKKDWVASEGVKHPESVEVILYRDGDVYKTVKLSEKNNWTYTWSDLTDEYTWSVDEKEVPAGYTKNVTVREQVDDSGYHYSYTITNTKNFKYIDVSVKKTWNGSGVTHPTSVKVTLYRDGVAYDTVTLSAANNWKYVWEDLTDEFEWEVDEPSVPSGYNKTVRVYNTYDFYISNTHEDNPKTGDFTDFLGLGLMGMVGIVGFCFTAFLLFVPRKKGKYER